MLYCEIRDWLLNHLAVWCMKHCHNWATIFYTACSRLEPLEVEGMAKSYLKSIGRAWK